jgi:hypothetical protein
VAFIYIQVTPTIPSSLRELDPFGQPVAEDLIASSSPSL